MKNTIYADADLNIELIANEEQDGNTIAVVIECDSAASQELTITAGTATTTEALTSGTKNTVDIPVMLWNFGDDTVITLSKGGTDAGTITIHFPGAIDSDAAINETETDNEVTMQGSASVQEQIVSLQESVERVSAQTLAYILPYAVSQSGIADGGSNTVETFEFEAGAEDVKVSFFTCVQFLAETTVTAANAYEDLMLTITITVDGVAAATILHTYRDGRQVLTLNHLIENLSKGNHTMTVNFAAAGGSVSVMQIIAAYLLTAKSTGGGTNTESDVFVNGDFTPGVLPDGFNKSLFTKEAYTNGTYYNAIKYLHSSSAYQSPDIEDLSGYFLSDYMLATLEVDGKLFYTENGTITRDYVSFRTGWATTNFYIPIKRMTGFNRVSCSAKCESHESFGNSIFIYACAVVNGEMVRTSITIVTNNGNWQSISTDISSLPYVDYIVLGGQLGKTYYKDIKLQKV